MSETLTESFCERCGTRYEFEAPARLNRLRKTRGFIGGLRNYLTSQDALSDAINDAMRLEEEGLSAAHLDAFHASFSFCINCRQYTCASCWNDTAGRCRSCVPVPGTDDLAERLAASVAGPALDAESAFPDAVATPADAVAAWPTSDLPADAEGWTGADAFPGEPEPVAAETADWVAAEIEAELAPELAPELWPAVAEVEPEPVVAQVEAEPEPIHPPLRVVGWDEDGAYELAEPEPTAAEVEAEPLPAAAEVEAEPLPAAAEVEPEPAPVAAEVEPEPAPVAAEVEPEPVVAEVEPEPVVAEVEPEPVVAEVEPEPVVAEVEPDPAPVAAEVEPEPVRPAPRIPPIHETILHFPAQPASAPAPTESDRAAAAAESPEVAARRAQLDDLGLGGTGEGPVAQQPRPLAYRSRGAGVNNEGRARAAALRDASFWEASAREVTAATGHVGVQSCGQCGLSLSANARFCRRCGTRQARSA